MHPKHHDDYKSAISSSGMDIYCPVEVGDADYWIPTAQLEALLNEGLQGLCWADLPIKTRGKLAKTHVCEALGYPAPKSFKRKQPRFTGQQLDVYVQSAQNLQIYNEQLSPSRRYVIIRVNEQGMVDGVKVANGQELALLDTTGTVTTKFQAGFEVGSSPKELVSQCDTPPIQKHVQAGLKFAPSTSPVQEPESGMLLPISEIFTRLAPLIGRYFRDPGPTQERNRGAALHRLICEQLGYSSYEDNGRFPDVRHQILEVKLQTSRTLDLGLVLPSSEGPLDIKQVGDFHPRHCDTRYAVFYATTDGAKVTLTHLMVVTGADFFSRFRQFEGKVKNGKIQIPLRRIFLDI